MALTRFLSDSSWEHVVWCGYSATHVSYINPPHPLKKRQFYRCARLNRVKTVTCWENMFSEFLEVEPLTQMHFNGTGVREKSEKQRGSRMENSRKKSRHNKAEKRAAGNTICCYSKWNILRIMPRLYVQFLEKVVNGKWKINPADIFPLSCILQVHFYISKQHKHIHSSRNKCKLHFSLVFRIVFVFIYLNASKTKSQSKKG